VGVVWEGAFFMELRGIERADREAEEKNEV
jgi:hypothetical protein